MRLPEVPPMDKDVPTSKSILRCQYALPCKTIIIKLCSGLSLLSMHALHWLVPAIALLVEHAVS